jgi:hypothetical protein
MTVTLCRFRSPGQIHDRQPVQTNKAHARGRGHQKRLSECFRAGEIFGLETIGTARNHWNRLLLGVQAQRDFPVQSDGRPQSAGQTENSFRQSQTILRDLKHHSLPKRHYSFWERLNRSFRFAIYRFSHYSPTLSALNSNIKSKGVTSLTR